MPPDSPWSRQRTVRAEPAEREGPPPQRGDDSLLVTQGSGRLFRVGMRSDGLHVVVTAP